MTEKLYPGYYTRVGRPAGQPGHLGGWAGAECLERGWWGGKRSIPSLGRGLHIWSPCWLVPSLLPSGVGTRGGGATLPLACDITRDHSSPSSLSFTPALVTPLPTYQMDKPPVSWPAHPFLPEAGLQLRHLGATLAFVPPSPRYLLLPVVFSKHLLWAFGCAWALPQRTHQPRFIHSILPSCLVPLSLSSSLPSVLSFLPTLFIVFFPLAFITLYPLFLLPRLPRNHPTGVPIHESFFLFPRSLQPLTSPPTPLSSWSFSISESVPILLVSSVCPLDSTCE